MLLDIAPTLAMYEGTTEAFARAYWHWFFLIQPPPLPERLIESNPTAYLRTAMGRRDGRHHGVTVGQGEQTIADVPGWGHSVCLPQAA